MFDFRCSSIAMFIDNFEQSQNHMSNTLDCIQAHRPFFLELFQLYLKQYHIKLTRQCQRFWNDRMKEFTGMEITDFLNLLHKQEHTINLYEMTDERYANSYNEIISTFCIRTFNNSMPILMNHLRAFISSHYVDGDGVCMSHTPVDVFSVLSKIFDRYESCPTDDLASAILGLIYKIQCALIEEIKFALQKGPELSVEILSSISNSNLAFMANLR